MLTTAGNIATLRPYAYGYRAVTSTDSILLFQKFMGAIISHRNYESESESSKCKDSSPTRVHCRTRVLHHCTYRHCI